MTLFVHVLRLTLPTGLCADLSPPSNGNVSVTTYEVGGTATYTCNLYSGFELFGVQNRTCLSNGTWSGLEPTCNCMLTNNTTTAQIR